MSQAYRKHVGSISEVYRKHLGAYWEHLRHERERKGRDFLHGDIIEVTSLRYYLLFLSYYFIIENKIL